MKCELKKEGAVNDRKYHYSMAPDYSMNSYERPTSGPKFCPEPGKILGNITSTNVRGRVHFLPD